MSRTLDLFHPYPPNRLHMAENSSDTEIWDRFYHQTTPSSLARNKEDEKEMRDRGQRAKLGSMDRNCQRTLIKI